MKRMLVLEDCKDPDGDMCPFFITGSDKSWSQPVECSENMDYCEYVKWTKADPGKLFLKCPLEVLK